MNLGSLVMRENHFFETHLNLMRDFTGNFGRISLITISSGRLLSLIVVVELSWLPSVCGRDYVTDYRGQQVYLTGIG